MPARRFFAVLNEARSLHWKEKAHFLHELCGIGMLPTQSKLDFYKELKSNYYEQFAEKKEIVQMTKEEALRHNRQVASRLYMLGLNGGAHG